MTRARLLTRPSLTPKMTARSVPDRPGRCRCQRLARRRSGGWSPDAVGAGLAAGRQISACSRSSAAIASTSGEAWRLVELLLVALERLDQVASRRASRTARASRMMTATRGPRAGSAPAGRRRRAPRSFPAQMSAWRRSLPAIRRNAAARLVVLLDRRRARRRGGSRRARAQVLEALGRHRGPSAPSLPRRRRRPCDVGATPRRRRLRYLSAADVVGGDAAARRAAAPRRADDGRARRRRRAAAQDRGPSPAGRLVRPRDAGPPPRRGSGRRGRPRRDEVGRGLPREPRRAGCPRSTALVLLIDAATGVPTAILDGGPITAERTAAVSGVAIAPVRAAVAGRPPRAALDRGGRPGPQPPRGPRPRPARRGARRSSTATRSGPAALADDARRDRRDRRRRRRGLRARGRRDADVVVTAASFGRPSRQVMTGDWLAPDALVVPVDYATYCAAEVARERGPVPRRPARAVPRQPRRRATSTATRTRPRRSARRSSPGTPRPARGRVVVTPPRCRAGRPRLRRRDRRPGRRALGLGTVLAT